MRFNNFSRKQEQVLCWWMPRSPHRQKDAIICDGAVRSGKTLCMSMSFILWAMSTFDGADFAICGKTITSCERNVLTPLQKVITEDLGMTCHYSRTLGYMEVTGAKSANRFYIFGGKDEGSAALIQGVTLAGILFDEVALMPRSFVDQAVARCSVTGSKFWFNCNPEGPHHWFLTEWINKRKKKRALYLHFTMADNPSLSPGIRERYEAMFTGVFYDRFIRGYWTVAEGLIYQQFADDKQAYLVTPTRQHLRDVMFLSIGIDFGGSRSLTTFVATAIHANYSKLTVVSDYHIKARKGEVDADRLCREFIGFIRRLRADFPGLYIKYVWADNEAQYLINSLRKAAKDAALGVDIRDCKKKPIKDRIFAGNTLLNTHRLLIAEDCTLVQGGLEGAVWNPKVPDERLDNFSTDIDILDGFEYSWEPFISRLCPDLKAR